MPVLKHVGASEVQMSPFEQQTIVSPDGRSEALLRVSGRTTRDLTCVRLQLAGRLFQDRVFDWQGVWSSCSRYFAIMEWRHEGYFHLPAGRLVVFDLREMKESCVDHVESGFVEPLRIYDGKIRYIRIDLTKGSRLVLEQPISASVRWAAIDAGNRKIA